MVIYFLSGMSLGAGSSFFRTLTCNNASRAGMDWIFLNCSGNNCGTAQVEAIEAIEHDCEVMEVR
jgi:hypothetical protein